MEFSTFGRAVVVLLGASLLIAQPSSAGERSWDPAKTFVFAVDLVKWKNDGDWKPLTEDTKQGRAGKRLKEFFEAAKVPSGNIRCLIDGQATKNAVTSQFDELLKKALKDAPKDDALIIVYFSGHGYRDAAKQDAFFVTHDAGKVDTQDAWSAKSIIAAINKDRTGGRALLLADSCHSGMLCEVVAGPPTGKVKFASLTSTHKNSTTLNDSTFIDALLSAFGGNAEADFIPEGQKEGDGKITLIETAQLVEGRVAFIKNQKAMFKAQKGFSGDIYTIASVKEKPTTPKLGYHTIVSNGQRGIVRGIDATSKQYLVQLVGGLNATPISAGKMREYRWVKLKEQTKVRVRIPNQKETFGTVIASWYGLHLVDFDANSTEDDRWIENRYVRPGK